MKSKIDSFRECLKENSFFLLLKLNKDIYFDQTKETITNKKIEKLINSGLSNLEISWSENSKWLEFVSSVKLKFPKINLGSASIVNKKSIDDSLKIGLNFSMMKFWDKDLLLYSREKNHLLIPGIKNIDDLKEAINLNCRIIKIYPVIEKDELIDIRDYKNIDFIAAGGLSINNLDSYKTLGYKSIVVGKKAFINNELDPNIFKWLKQVK